MYELVFHIADLHIRRGNEQNARYEEYRSVFEQFLKMIRERSSGKKCAIVICGDIFHHKLEIAPAGIRLFYDLIHALADMMSVLIIQGNHDLLQEKFSDENNDLIEALLQRESHPNVRYLCDTGLYKFDNLEFGVVSIRDVLRSGASSGMVDALPPFPKPSEAKGVFRVALAHCTVKNCMLSATQKSLEGVPVEWFSSYDVAMLGDIHLQHVVRNKTHSVVYGYPGSMVQQNFGEPLFDHGFIEWEVRPDEPIRYTRHHVPNTYGKLNAHIEGSDEDWTVFVNAREKIPLHELLEARDVPTQLHIRLYAGKKSSGWIDRVVEHVRGTLVGRIVHVDVINTQSTSEQEGALQEVDLSELNRMDTIVSFLETHMREEVRALNPDWLTLIKDPDGFALEPQEGFPPRISELLRSKNESVASAILKSGVYTEDTKHAGMKRFRLHRLQFNWILPFGRQNCFDFTHRQKICLINAPNGYGKTAFFEVIMLGLFGEPIPSRHNKGSSLSILNKRRVVNTETSNIEIEFDLNEDRYRIKRIFHEQCDKKQVKRLQSRVAELYRNDELIHSGSKVISEWMRENVCVMNDFLLFNMITQNVDMDFIKMSQKEQIEMLDSAFHINYFNHMCDMLKVIRKEYKDLERHIVTHLKAIEPSESLDHEQSQQEEARISDMKKRLLQNELDWLESKEQLADLIVDERKFDNNSPNKSQPTETLEELSNTYVQLRAKLKEHDQMGFEARIYSSPLSLDFVTEHDPSVPPLKSEDSLDVHVRSMKTLREKLPDEPPPKPASEMSKQFTEAYLKEEIAYLKDSMTSYEEGMSLEPPAPPTLSQEEIRKLEKTITEEVREMLHSMTSEQAREEAATLEERIGNLYDKIPKPSDLDLPSESKEQLVESLGLIQEKIGIVRREIEIHRLKESEMTNTNTEIDRLNERLKQMDIRMESDRGKFNPECSSCNARLEAFEELKKERSLCLRRRNKLVKSRPKQIQENAASRMGLLENKLEEYEGILALLQKHIDEHERLRIIDDIRVMKARSGLLERYEELKILFKNLSENRRLYKEWVAYDNNQGLLSNIKEAERKLTLVLARDARERYEVQLGSLRQVESLVRNTMAYREGCTEMACIQDQMDDVRTKLSYYADMKRKLMERVREHELIDRDTRESLMLATSKRTAYREYNHLKERMTGTLEVLQNRQVFFDEVLNTIKRYKAWVYNDKFLPVVVQKANEILLTLFEDRDLTIKFEFQDESLCWFVQDEGNLIHVEKLSGAQAFAVGLSMRLGLGSMGISKYKCDQLFIDEGFCNFDQNNLSRVPLLLTRMGKLFKNIIMVTHVEEIKNAAHEVVNIRREDGLSQLFTV